MTSNLIQQIDLILSDESSDMDGCVFTDEFKSFLSQIKTKLSCDAAESFRLRAVIGSLNKQLKDKTDE